MKVLILKKRKDFIRAAKGLKSVTPSLILQAAQSLSSPNKPILTDGCYLGFTATKKLGKAHIRNLVKRRLRAAAAECFADNASAGADYVLIGRYNTATIDFERLKADMVKALQAIKAQKDSADETPDNLAD